MNEVIKTTFLGLFFGTFGTTIGGIIGVKSNNVSDKTLSFILNFAAGLMIAIVCFELIPEALEISSILYVVIGTIFGIAVMLYCDKFVNKKYNKGIYNKNALLKTGIIVGIGLAIHNFPEGLAIGSGFEHSVKLGLSLALAIAFHDIPEGISMALPMKNGGMSSKKTLFYTILSGITTGIGALFGVLFGGISERIIAFCLSFAAGCMIYIVSRRINTRIKWTI